MAKNYIQPGEVLDFTNTTGATIASGAGVLIGVRLGVAKTDIANNATGSVAMKGVHELPKLGTDVVAQGALLYWDNTNKRLTTTASGNTAAGYAAAAASGSVSTVRLSLNA
jgi:predicted RecA/RadA family phage recombinase